ncbi:hypothetical protein CGZ75_22065 [Paenibacillus herberti]|uniref:PA14 domain-containing protein n=2 Tax=Paenibacillus herberti TaxID=1619309 RepID=A0A229NUX5_9BACL|nr:hypothetical protein CGZ75_22065 [Paenibacillus herberti]
MDTWDGNRFLETAGVVFNGVSAKEADATAQVLAEAGFRSARVEIGWGNISFDNESKLVPHAKENMSIILQALQKHNLRPIILLNANSGNPVPSKLVKTKLKRAAKKGAREIYVSTTSNIKPNFTGLSGQAYQTMYPIITDVDAKTGRLKLSAPLTKNLNAGELKLTQLKYRPFSGIEYSDGKVNPYGAQTYAGWLKYVKTLTTEVKRILNTENKDDAGFDLEVWNELTFGSQFLDINHYYEKKIKFSKEYTLVQGDRTSKGIITLLPLTIQYIKDTENRLPNVNVINGFSNQRPWDNGTELLNGQNGFSRHYYTEYSANSLITRQSDSTLRYKHLYSNGQSVTGKEVFVPNHVAAMPEYWFYGYKTEFVVRDIQPFPGPWTLHSRYANNGNGQSAQVWMTETNWWRGPFADELMKKAKVRKTDPRLTSLMQQIGAKTTLRLLTMASHKGIQTVNIYSAKGGDLNHGVFSDKFFKVLKANNYKLTDEVRAAAGPQIKAMKTFSAIMREGQPIKNTRALHVEKVVEPVERLVWKGDGSTANPDRYNRDDLAILPYQLNDKRFAIAYYVVTRNMTQPFQGSYGLLDPKRYTMIPQKFEITLSNVAGIDAKVYVLDPITQEKENVVIKNSSPNTLTVEVNTVDYPRLLMVEEKAPGPLLTETELVAASSNAGASFSLKSNVSGKAIVSWGTYPARSSGAFTLEKYASKQDPAPLQTYQIPLINKDMMPALTKGYWKWKGILRPKFSEHYSFIMDTASCNASLKVNNQPITSGCGTSPKANEIYLEAGKTYELEMTLLNVHSSGKSFISLYWASETVAKTLVPADSAGINETTIDLVGNSPASVQLPDFKKGDGVKVSFTTNDDSLTTRFPNWDYDTRGVWWENQP